MIPRGILDEISRWMREGRYGHIQINFAGGKIMNVNRVETVKVEMLIITTTNSLAPSDSINLTAPLSAPQ